MLRKDIVHDRTLPKEDRFKGEKRQRDFQFKLREPIIPVSVSDVKLIIQLLALNREQSKVLFDRNNANFTVSMRKPDDYAVSDRLGCLVLSIVNEVYQFLPNNLPQKIIFKLFEQHGYLINTNKDDEKKYYSLKNIIKPAKHFFAALLNLKQLSDPLYFVQIKDIKKLLRISDKAFTEIYSRGVIPEGFEHIDVQSFTAILIRTIPEGQEYEDEYLMHDDKTFRFWLSLGIHLGLVDKNAFESKMDELSMQNYLDFEAVRTKLHHSK